MPLNFKSTSEIQVPKRLIDQVIGQESAVEIMKKAALQRRHVLLIGEPGTGKSMLGLGLAEMLPKEKLVDTVSFPNPNDENTPLIRTMPAGKGRDLVFRARLQTNSSFKNQTILLFIVVLIVSLLPYYFWRTGQISDIIFAASMMTGIIFIIGFMLFLNLNKRMSANVKESVPKVIVDNFNQKHAPFMDATGAHAGALLGDVLHDPFQCIPGNEYVHLANGKPVPIRELVEPFLGSDGEYCLEEDEQFDVLGSINKEFGYSSAHVTKVYRRQFDGELIVIETRRGYKIRVTPNHPIAIFNKTNIEFIPGSAVTKGMMSIVPDKLPITAEGKLPHAFLHFIAEALSDGSIRDRSIVFKVRTPWKSEQYQKTIRAIGINPKVIYRGKDIEIYVNSSEMVQRLIALGVKKDGKKHVPSIIFSLSQEQIMNFLARYISIDGYVGAQGQFEIVSKELIPDLTALLLKCGVRAKVRYRIDHGFGKAKGIIQPRIIFGDYNFAKAYHKLTINPIHHRNLEVYFASAAKRHVSQDDILPVEFSWLEKIRIKSGLSQTKTHSSYYALKSGLHTSHAPTRNILQKIVSKFLTITNDEELFKLRDLVQGTFAFDDIISIRKEQFKGHVFNLTTTTGTYVVSQILTHNSGGLGTPAHERVVAGMIHKANMGVLFVDEIATLEPATQQELLTALQEGKYPITGQSERSAGAMVRTEAVPCTFILVAAGNAETVARMHPALRSRIRGYGYEVFMKETIKDTPENRDKIAVFVAQEVTKDKKIPHFSREAVDAIIEEARYKANRKSHLTLRLRELGGLIRAAGDLAKEQNSKLVEKKHITDAKKIARTLEQQMADRYIERKKEYEVIVTEGRKIGRVNGLAVIGSEDAYSGIILPIESEVAFGGKEKEIIATGKLGEIAREAVKNVSAIIKKYFGEDVKEYDIHVQFLQTYEGVEGDSASIAVAASIISALKNIPVKQDVAMTGSLSVRGEVLPVGGVSSKVEAAFEAGIKKVIVPKSNMQDIIIDKKKLEKIEIIPVENISQVLEQALYWKGKEGLLKRIRRMKQ